MDYKEIKLEYEDGVCTITFNRPESMNVFTFNMLREIKHGMEYCANDPATRVVILTGSGRVFSAGGDINTMASGLNSVEAQWFIEASADMVRLISSMGKPVIAAVNGLAVGAGFNYAIACDIVISSQKAKFSQGFLGVGLAPDAGGTYFLPRLLGLHKAKEMIWTNQMIDAMTAEKMGLINQVVEHEKLQPTAMELAKSLAKGPSQAIAITKLLLNRSLDADLNNALAAEAYAQVMLMNSVDHKEGIQAFLEKRKPEFKA